MAGVATPGAPATRVAVQYAATGPSSVLQLVTDAPVPARKKGQVLIDNKAAGVNPVDYKLRSGAMGRLAGPRLPCIPGGDVAGVVLEADEGSAFKPGDRVMCLLSSYVGGYTSKVVAPESLLAPIPDNLTFEQAAAMPLVALTAWQAFEMARVKAGDRVLIHAGAGGVGSVAIQLAKARGLWVATTCSSRNVEFVKQLGADEVCDYTAERFEEQFRDTPFDAVLDFIAAGGYEERSLAVLKRTGCYVQFLAHLKLLQAAKGFLKGALGLGPRYRIVMVSSNGAQLTEIAKLAQDGKVKPTIAKTLPLAKAGEAQDEVEKGHTRGKIVLIV